MPGWRIASISIGIASAGATLSTLLGVGTELAAPNNSGSTGGMTVAVRQSAQVKVGQEITKCNVSIQPPFFQRGSSH